MSPCQEVCICGVFRWIGKEHGLQTLYGYDDIKGRREIIIVEGEMDKLAMEVAGFQNVASVPDGAPARVSPLPPRAQDKKFDYVWNRWAHLL